MRCFSSVRGERPRNRAASAVRKYRGGRPAFGSGIWGDSVFVWCAGDIIGASTDTMAEESLKGGCRRLGGVFSAPLSEHSLLPRWSAQQCAIATPHQSEAVLDQADGQAAKIMVLPGAATDALLAEQALCDFAIVIPRQPCV